MIRYTSGYKYQLAENYTVKTPVTGCKVINDYFRIDLDGTVTVFRGYAWDGASGPTWDTRSSITPSMVHDVFCQCLRSRWISYDHWQDTINAFFREQCIACGMWPWRASIWHWGVEFGDAGNPCQGPDRQVLVAP